MIINRHLRTTLGTSMLLATMWAAPASASDSHRAGGSAFTFSASASGAQEVPASDSAASGEVVVRFDRALTELRVVGRLRGLETPVLAAHFHCGLPGANGPVAVGIMGPGPLTEIDERFRVSLSNDHFTGADCAGPVGRPVTNVAALYFAMREGLIYVNIHTGASPSGELRGQLIGR